MTALSGLDRSRQASAAGLRAMRQQHARSVAQVHALINAGQEEMRKQEDTFLKAYRSSRRELRRTIRELQAQYEAEVERIAAVERERMAACRRRLKLLRTRSAAMAATRQAIAMCEVGGDGRLYAEPVDPADPVRRKIPR
jgi:hypothetical protein